MQYLMFRIQQTMSKNDAPGFIFIDETAPMLQDPKFRAMYLIMLREFRKKHGVVISVFQSPDAIKQSGIAEQIRQAMSAYYLFPAKSATAADYAIISGTLSGTGGLTKSGTGTLVLTGANTYTGATSITGGTLALSGSGAISSANLAINTGGVFATAGTFTRGFGTGAGQVALSSTSGGGFAAYGGALTLSLGSATWGTTTGFFSASTGPLILGSVNAHDVVTWTSDINLGALARTITVNDNISTTADYAVISGNFSGTGGLVKAGTGTLVLTGANTYSGVTQVSAGTLSVAALPDGVVSSSPIGTNATLKLGATTGTGTLLYTGTGGPADRVIDLAGTTGGGVITNNGTGALVFTAPSFTATGAGAKTLTLSGTNTDANEIQGTIVNSTSATSLTKSGPGTWKLAGANTYTGTTTLSAGTLIAGNNAAFGTGSLAFSGGTLAGDGTTRTLANILTMGVSSTIGGASDLIFNGLLTNSASVTLTVANSAATTLSAVNLSNSGTGRTLTLNATGGDVTKAVNPQMIFFTGCEGVRAHRVCKPGDILTLSIKPKRMKIPLATFEGSIRVGQEKAVIAEEITLTFGFMEVPAQPAVANGAVNAGEPGSGEPVQPEAVRAATSA
jgi:autotransporter-associated beta strand protein